jgi:cell division protein FtsL
MKILRISNILCIGAATGLGVLLFWTSQAVQQKEAVLENAQQKLQQEVETVRVLAVEWDYLNRPDRLEKLAKEQLGMSLPASTEMVNSVDDIPEPIIVHTDPEFYEEGIAQSVSYEPVAPKAPPPAPVISPSAAERSSFDQLIQNLESEGADTP